MKRYYQELEGGLLHPRGLSQRVWTAVRRLVGSEAERAAAWRSSFDPLVPGAAYFRAEASPLAHGVLLKEAAEPEERDEVDELFAAGQ